MIDGEKIQIYWQEDKHKEREVDESKTAGRQTVKYTERETDRQKIRRTDRQTDTYIDIQEKKTKGQT